MACAFAVIPLAWRVTDVAAEIRRERLGTAALQHGVALFEAARYAEASDAFRVAITQAPKNANAYQRFAGAEFKLGHFDNAIAAYRDLIAIYPYTFVSPFYWEVAMIEMSAGRYEAARDDLLTAVALEPTEWRPYFFLGISYRRLGDLANARAAWQRVLTLNPNNPYAREELQKLDRPHR
jgi:tetratricopeptide (TPR) repeat protein